jgi:recombinational DNA repair ATPase RecF
VRAVHLRAVKLRGFKSFPDPVEIRLEPGVGVIVGPNGSGKSNVSDAIRWAAGSLSPTELRAALRKQGVHELSVVENAILESDGFISVLRKDEKEEESGWTGERNDVY